MSPEPGPESPRLVVDVVSDVVCPWCYIGKRRLAAALDTLASQSPEAVAQVRWHPFQLNPDLPPEGVPRQRYLEGKFGSGARASAIYARVSAVGREVGIPFDFDAMTRQPNTLDAHCLIDWVQARQPNATSGLVERLFRAWFVEGRFIGDRAELARIAGEAGCDAAEAAAMLDAGERRDAVTEADERARAMGIGGVPFFIFNGRTALSGAHEPSTLLRAIDEALQVPA